MGHLRDRQSPKADDSLIAVLIAALPAAQLPHDSICRHFQPIGDRGGRNRYTLRKAAVKRKREPPSTLVEHRKNPQEVLGYRLGVLPGWNNRPPLLGYPAQQESWLTSFVKICAQSLMPSTMVRYGNNCPPRSVTVIPARNASATVWIISPASAARI